MDAEPRCCGSCSAPLRPKQKRFCSHKCTFAVIGARVLAAALTPTAIVKSADARRRRGKKDGYVKRGGRHEHRAVAEQKLGRPLRPGEIVHHEDENKGNNAPTNLAVLSGRAEHARLHFAGRKRVARALCRRGHALTGENVYVHPNGRRICILCRREYDSDWKRARRRTRAEAAS